MFNREESNSEEYKEWRKAVYKRDGYRCVCCNKKSYLNAHHLEGWSWCVMLRYEPSNGVTLCARCHNSFHKTWGRGNNTRQQFEIFLLGYGKTIEDLNL